MRRRSWWGTYGGAIGALFAALYTLSIVFEAVARHAEVPWDTFILLSGLFAVAVAQWWKTLKIGRQNPREGVRRHSLLGLRCRAYDTGSGRPCRNLAARGKDGFCYQHYLDEMVMGRA